MNKITEILNDLKVEEIGALIASIGAFLAVIIGTVYVIVHLVFKQHNNFLRHTLDEARRDLNEEREHRQEIINKETKELREQHTKEIFGLTENIKELEERNKNIVKSKNDNLQIFKDNLEAYVLSAETLCLNLQTNPHPFKDEYADLYEKITEFWKATLEIGRKYLPKGALRQDKDKRHPMPRPTMTHRPPRSSKTD